jgi:hypothetical protein
VVDLSPFGQLVHAVARPALVAYVPALQSVHEAWPLDACAFPPGQSVQADVPEADAYWPEGHDVQTDAPAALYLPAVQTEQRVAPSTVETRPASQAVQLGADAAEYWPLVHWAQLVAATSLYLPATQSLHEVWACKFWNWPMPQLRQSVAPVEVP